MPFKHFGQGGGAPSPFGNPYLKADAIRQNDNVTILEVIEQEDSGFRDTDGSIKPALRINVMHESGPNSKSTSCWTPGTMAASAMIEEFGDEPDNWKNQKAHFSSEKWKTANRSGTSWCLLSGWVGDTKIDDPADSNLKEGEQFDCGYCKIEGKRFMSDDVNEFNAHLLKKHGMSTPAVPKTETKKGKKN